MERLRVESRVDRLADEEDARESVCTVVSAGTNSQNESWLSGKTPKDTVQRETDKPSGCYAEIT